MMKSIATLLALAALASAQFPDGTPDCVQVCATSKVQEGYCGSENFSSAYSECLYDNCAEQSDRDAGEEFSSSVCSSDDSSSGDTSDASTASNAPANNASVAAATPAANASAATPAVNASAAAPVANASAAVPVPSAATPFAAPLPPSSVTSNSSYAQGAVQALNAGGLATLATLVGSSPPALLDELQKGNHTVFAPTNDALNALAATNLPAAAIQATIEYHVLSNIVVPSVLSTSNHTLYRTALKGKPYVNLPGNQSQVIALSAPANGTGIVVVEGAGNTTSVINATYQNLQLQIIPKVLTIPPALGDALVSVPDLSNLASAVNTVSPQLVSTLGNISGITIFAPVNAAFASVQSVIGSANPGTIQAVLLNHIINGSALYSPLLTSGHISAGGQVFNFTTNSTGSYVISGPASAKILKSDVIIQNGVIHLIDGVLMNTGTNAVAAASAASSAASVQATATSAVIGPIKPSATKNSGLTNAGINFTLLFVSIALCATLMM